MTTTWTKEQFWTELEKLGESDVRVRLVTKVYGDFGDKKALAEEWLYNQERSRRDKLNLEQSRIARSAKNAAWIAAIAATIAAISAVIVILLNYKIISS